MMWLCICAPWWWCDCTETCQSCFKIDFGIVFKAILLCISWWIKSFDNIMMHGTTVKKKWADGNLYIHTFRSCHTMLRKAYKTTQLSLQWTPQILSARLPVRLHAHAHANTHRVFCIWCVKLQVMLWVIFTKCCINISPIIND
jgi:hypothetical protein